MSKTSVQVKEIQEDDGGSYEITRPAGMMEQVFTIYNQLGHQSSLISAATYGNESQRLTRHLLYPALRELISQHYALSQITIVRRAEGKAGQHHLWEGQLRSIDLDRMVEFTEADDSDRLQSIIESTHNEWLDPEDHEVPRWRLKVVNGRHLLFVYSHTIADGLSGYAFHRCLLRLLNERGDETVSTESIVEPPRLDPPECWDASFPGKFSYLRLIWDVVLMHVVRFFYRSAIMFSDLVADDKPMQWPSRPDESVRCKTKLHTLRICADFQKNILAACKQNGVTFTTLLHTVATMTAAADMYPDAKIGLCSTVISLRPYTNPKQSPDTMTNSASSFMIPRRLGQYREAARPPHEPFNAKVFSGVYIDPRKTWAVTKDYMGLLRHRLDNHSLCNGLLSWKIMGGTMESIVKQVFPNVWLYSRYFLMVSNLGVFDAQLTTSEEQGRGQWSIEDTQFSAAAVKSNMGPVAPVFNVAGVRGGDCVIHAVTEAGLFPEARMQKMLDNIEQRLHLLVELDKQGK